jgi:hypothetical protein
MRHHNLQVTGSVSVNGISAATAADLGAYTGSNDTKVSTLQSFTASVIETNTFTASANSRLGSIENFTASVNTTNTFTASATLRLNDLETKSASVDTLNTEQNTRLTNLEIKTGSLATTGSNTFIGTQTITGSLYISSDLVVQGSSSLQNITASAVSIGTNIINLNTANPAIRYAGLSIGDSGSIGSSGSFLYDSVQDEMIFVHRGANTTVTSSVVIMGPQTYDSIGNETYLTNNQLVKGAGNEHLADSNISDTGTLVSVNSPTIFLSGSVGIGTTTPSQSLHVAGRIYSVTSGTDGGQILLANSGGGSTWYWAARTTGLNLGELTAADGRIFIKNGGNVGIGTDNPGSKLTIRGTDSTSMLYLGISSSSTTGEAVGITFGSATYDKARIVAYNQNAGNAEGYLTFWTGGTPTTTDVSEKVRISSEGLVGIGTTGPDRLLHINGNTSTTTPLQKVQNTGIGDAVTEYRVTGASWYVGIDNSDSDKFKIGQDPLGTSDRFIIADGGYIGIGTNSPGDKLHVYASGYDANIRLTDAGVANADWSLLASSGTTTAIFRLYNRATATTCTTWTTDGKVGIGTTSPTTLLHLSSTYNGGATGQMHMTSNGTEGGTITFEKTSGTAQKYKFGLGTNQLFVYNETAGNQPFTITSSGNVGIGATNPSKKLTVDGRMSTSAIVSGNLIAGNIYTNISTSPSYILITDLNNTAGFSMSGKVNAASYTCWNISDIWIEKDYSSTTARAGIVGSYKSGCDFSIVDISYGAGRYVALRFTSNPEIDVMFTGYRLADLYQSDGTATVATSGVTVNGTYASY